MALRTLFSDPEAFMERKAGGRSLRREVIALLLVGALAVPGLAYAGQVIQENLGGNAPGEAGSTGSVMMVGIAIEPIVGIFLIWIGSAVTAHIVANRFMRSREPILYLLKTSAWAFLPIGLGNLVRSGTLYLYFSNPDLPDDPEGTTVLEIVQSLIGAAKEDPIVLAGLGVVILTVLYSGYLLSYAIQAAKDIPHDDALKVAAIPTVAIVLYLLQGLL